MHLMRHVLSNKAHKVLDMIGYNLDRTPYHSSQNGWVIGKTRKFVALGLTVDEALEAGILLTNPYDKLWLLCDRNSIIHIDWIKEILSPEDFTKFQEFMIGQTSTQQGIYASDVKNFLEKLITDNLTGLPHGY